MNIHSKIYSFWSDESGAVTVDWVALVASLVLIGVGLAVSINGKTDEYADKISSDIESRGVMTFG